MRTVAVIQARLGSTRLPMKSLLCLRGVPLIDWVTDRVRMARTLDGIIVACPDTALDRPLADHLRRRGVPVITGPENDVLARFVLAAKAARADRIVRVCADNPLVWGEAIDRLTRFQDACGADYCYNHVPRGNLWPDGLGAEIVSCELLELADRETAVPSQREHCLNFFRDTPGRFSIATFDPEEDWLKRPDVKLDIDTPEDYCRMARMPIDPGMDARSILLAADETRRQQTQGD